MVVLETHAYFEWLVEGEITINIKVIIFYAWMMLGGLWQYQIAHCIVCLKVDHGSKYGVISLMKTKRNDLLHWNPFYDTESQLCIAKFVHNAYWRISFNYLICIFLVPQKCHLAFIKLVEIVKTKRPKVFQNVKTRWINMQQPLKHVHKDYKISNC